MSKNKKKKRSSATASVSSIAPLDSETVTRDLDFDAMEDKIRGEEMLMKSDLLKAKEALEIKKKFSETEVDKKLEQLRKQLGLKKNH